MPVCATPQVGDYSRIDTALLPPRRPRRIARHAAELIAHVDVLNRCVSQRLFERTPVELSEAASRLAAHIYQERHVVFAQRLGGITLRLSLENLPDNEYRFTQGSEPQRVYKLGRTVAFSLSYNLF